MIRIHILAAKTLASGNQDTIIIELPSPEDKPTIGIIDCADFDYFDQYMTKNNLFPKRVEFIVATHPHEDHIKGMLKLLQEYETREIAIGEYWDSGFTHTSDTYELLQNHLEQKFSDRIRYPKDDTEEISYGDVKINFLAPKGSGDYWRSKLNNSSIVIHLKYKTYRKVIFGGDAQTESWSAILSGEKKKLLRAELLKVPHHGSRRGMSDFEMVVDYIKPEFAVITGDKPAEDPCHGKHCFPHPTVVGNLKSVKDGGNVYCTYDYGDIVVEIGEDGIERVLTSRQPVAAEAERTCCRDDVNPGTSSNHQ